jgi:hypothetical protein
MQATNGRGDVLLEVFFSEQLSWRFVKKDAKQISVSHLFLYIFL